MAGMTSQPSMGAIVAALQNDARATGIEMSELFKLIEYWESVRFWYAAFESGQKSGSAEVYEHEMPGGQYTNLQFQSTSLGLSEQWGQVKKAYAAANRLLGDIVKVTPSSKVVGDLAQFIVANNLTEESLLEEADTLSFPSSVVDFMQGYLGVPEGGFPEPLRTKVLKGATPIEGRPGESLPPVDLGDLKIKLQEEYGKYSLDERDVISAAMYPDVFKTYRTVKAQYGDLGCMPTRLFLTPMKVDEEVSIEVERGVSVLIKYKAVGELLSTGEREVFFEVNGIPRVVDVLDKTQEETTAKEKNEKADPDAIGSVGAPMSGSVVEVQVKAGSRVQAGEPLVVLTAMKMETTVSAPCSGRVAHVGVIAGDAVAAGDLLTLIEA